MSDPARASDGMGGAKRRALGMLDGSRGHNCHANNFLDAFGRIAQGAACTGNVRLLVAAIPAERLTDRWVAR